VHLNTLKPDDGSRTPRRRVGRGTSSGSGKTCGRGTKGQRSRTGGGPKAGFEGGQMPLQRRLPKVGFRSRTAIFSGAVALRDLVALEAEVIDLDVLKAARLVAPRVRKVKVVLKGEIGKPLVIRGLTVTRGARAAIEAANGRIED